MMAVINVLGMEWCVQTDIYQLSPRRLNEEGLLAAHSSLLWHITKLISSIICLSNVTRKTTALNCQFTNCFRLLSKEGDCNTTLHNKPIHYINKAAYSNAFHDNRFMNNHTCKIIDFLSGGKINKPLYFI